jgi:hypothetical protein
MVHFIEDHQPGSPLSQGDILSDFNLFLTDRKVDGPGNRPVPTGLAVVDLGD